MGSGAKVFTAGEVLTASDMNTYLASRVVAKQTTAPSASTPFATPEAGSMAYYDSGDANEGLYIYTGTTWNKGPGWNAPWGILTSTHVATNVQINASHTAETVVCLSTAVTLVANRTIKITAAHAYTCAATGVVVTHKIRRGATTVGATSMVGLTEVGYTLGTSIFLANVQGGSNIVAIDKTYTAGSIQYSLTSSSSAANVDSTPTTIIVEDIGPSGAPN